MSILVNNETKVIVQGITGSEGNFHSYQMFKYGTKIVAGVTPGKGGLRHLGRPVFNSVSDALNKLHIDVSIIFVPPRFAADAIIESIKSNVKLIVKNEVISFFNEK